MLQVRGGGIVSDPPLPARATVPARGSALVAVLDGSRGGELLMDSLPGDPSARPRDVEYLLPLQQRAYRIDQGFGGDFSHNDPQNRYAVDFAADIGTPVLAAREGVVMQVESDFEKAGLNRERYGGRANFIRILHDDGTMAPVRAPADPKARWCASASAYAPASRSAYPATPASPPARTCISRCR